MNNLEYAIGNLSMVAYRDFEQVQRWSVEKVQEGNSRSIQPIGSKPFSANISLANTHERLSALVLILERVIYNGQSPLIQLPRRKEYSPELHLQSTDKT